MDIYEKIQNGDYKVKDVPYVPFCEDKEAHIAWRKEEGRLLDQFRADVKEDLGVTDNPKADQMMALAWEYGHSSGLSEVYHYAAELVDLIK